MPNEVVMQEPPTTNVNRSSVLLWCEGNWRCELHPAGDGWRYHLFRGEDLLATRAKMGDGIERGEALRRCVGGLCDPLASAEPPPRNT